MKQEVSRSDGRSHYSVHTLYRSYAEDPGNFIARKFVFGYLSTTEKQGMNGTPPPTLYPDFSTINAWWEQDVTNKKTFYELKMLIYSSI